MSGLFSIFNIATRGMAVQDKAINVTSHNIANANTDGYSRQRVQIETTRPFGMPSMNNAAEPGQLGTGAAVTAIERVRDTFLDYQVRVETSTQGQYQARQTYLSQVEGVFNEPSDTGLSSIIGKFFDSWQQLSKQPQSSNARTVVAQQALDLTNTLNHTATQLDNLKSNTQGQIKDDIFQVNDMLNQLDKLNQQIIGVKVAGNEPNDLMDKRDSLLDQLSSKFGINIDKKNFDGIDVSPVDGSTSAAQPSLVKATNNSQVNRFSYVNDIVNNNDGTYNVSYYPNGDSTQGAKTITVQMTAAQAKQLDECRVLVADSSGDPIASGAGVLTNGTSLTQGSPSVDFSDLNMFTPSSGELKGYMSVQQDMDDYHDQLDKLAKSIAFSVNAVHSGQSDPANDGTVPPFFTYMNNNGVADNNNTNEANITAKNISINPDILNDPMKINAGVDSTSGETDGSRALAIAQIRDQSMLIGSIDSTSTRLTFTGGSLNTNNGLGINTNPSGTTIDSYFKDVVDRLGVQSQEAQRVVKNQESLLANFQQSKESVSGVSIDEEMANLVQYQHAYQANAKVISTVDELLDVVVNGLKK